MDKKPKYAIIAAAWIFYLIFAACYNGSSGTGDTSSTKTATESPAQTQITELTNEIETTIPETEPVTEKTTEAFTTEETKEEGKRDESLNGRGRADSGRSEPQYVGIIGYVAVYTNEEKVIESSGDYTNTELWKVPTYEQDKQFWNETDTKLEHKTEVLVKKQILEHEGYGRYTGYLLVERISDAEQFYINVSNFVTKPYWTYSDLVKAAETGWFVAEFNQKSDYYPVNVKNEKVDISDGTIVLVKGKTGTYSKDGPKSSTTQLEAELNDSIGVPRFFNTKDLNLIY